MAKRHDKVWYIDDKGKKWPAVVTRGQTFVDGLPAPAGPNPDDPKAPAFYDADTVDLVMHSQSEDESTGIVHATIQGGATAVKAAKTEADKKVPRRWWPRSKAGE